MNSSEMAEPSEVPFGSSDLLGPMTTYQTGSIFGRWIDLCDGGDATCRYRYCSNLFASLKFLTVQLHLSTCKLTLPLLLTRENGMEQNPGIVVTCQWNVCLSLAILDPRVGHTTYVFSPFIPVLCHSDWLFHGESCPRLDVVQPGRAWPSSPACTWHCSLHYLFLQATPLFPNGVTIVCYLPGMLMRPAGHEAEARKSEDEAEAQKFFRGRGHNVWGRGQTR